MKIILVDAWNTFVKEKKIDNELYKILEAFSNKKIILTNASQNERKEYGIMQMPYNVFSLSHNPEKTDPKYFEILCSKYNFNPDDLLYIEHNKKAYKTATLFGIISFLYEGDNKSVEDFLLKNCYD
tara:strand:- start:278 stop:655 length:378 start_codon:yes stop_codon:yes gene_type:complete